jgi:hypothetical protein
VRLVGIWPSGWRVGPTGLAAGAGPT